MASSIDFSTLSLNADGAPPASIGATSALAAIPEQHTNLLRLAAIAFMATRRRRP